MTKEQLDGLRIKFWDQLLDQAKEDGRTSIKKRNNYGDPDNHKNFSPFQSGYEIRCYLKDHDIMLEVYLNPGDMKFNKHAFLKLESEQAIIEKELGFDQPMDWQSPGKLKTGRIKHVIRDGGLLDLEKWATLRERIINDLYKMENVFRKRIATL